MRERPRLSPEAAAALGLPPSPWGRGRFGSTAVWFLYVFFGLFPPFLFTSSLKQKREMGYRNCLRKGNPSLRAGNVFARFSKTEKKIDEKTRKREDSRLSTRKLETKGREKHFEYTEIENLEIRSGLKL